MTPEALLAIDAMMSGLSRDMQITDPRRVHNVAPRIAQGIEDRVMQSNAFLKQIRNLAVRERNGDILAFGVPSTVTRRTRNADSKGSLRRPSDPTSLLERSYHCWEIEQDTLISWDKIDMWAHLADFYERFRKQVLFAQARDRLLVMWHGQATANQTDPETYQQLEDVNEGFFQFMINEHPENVLGLQPDGSIKPIKIDAKAADADFKNLDDLVYHLRYELLHRLFRNRTELKVLVGDELMVRENTALLGGTHQNQPTERAATGLLLNSRSFGRTDVIESDEFPMRGIFLSEMGNLSRYWQESSYRRKVSEDDQNQKGIVDYLFVREDYVVEAAEGCACVHPDAIHLKDHNDEWRPAGMFTDSTTFVAEPWKMAVAE